MDIRRYRDGDRDAVIALIAECYREYDYELSPDNYDADLLDVQGFYADAGGAFWVLDDAGEIRCTAALLPAGRGTVGIRRMYAARRIRGTGWARRILAVMLDWSGERGYEMIEAWSDLRFKRAHAFYRKYGFVTDGQTRDCDDFSEPFSELRLYRAV